MIDSSFRCSSDPVLCVVNAYLVCAKVVSAGAVKVGGSCKSTCTQTHGSPSS